MKKVKRFSVKWIAVIAAVAIIFSCLSAGFIGLATRNSIPEGITVWDGTVATAFASGSGTAADPYIIETPEQLAYLASVSHTDGKYYKLKNDIYLNDITAENWQKTAKSWYDSAVTGWATFTGTLDGDGHTVYGLYYNGSSDAGLIIWAKDAEISNLNIRECQINSSSASDYGSAALCAYASGNVTLNKCTLDESVSVKTNSKSAAGFIASGSPANVKISNSFSTATISAKTVNGAFIGDCWSGTSKEISSSFTAGLPFVGRFSYTLTNCYNTVDETSEASGTSTKISDTSKMKGLAAKENMPNLDWARGWRITASDYPEVRILGTEGEIGQVWSGNVATKFAGGKGTIAEPYIIETAEQLARMVKHNESGACYSITQDIYLNDVSADNWTDGSLISWYDSAALNGGAFSGTVDGNGNTIYGLYYNGNGYYAALLSQANNTTVKNLNLRKSFLKSTGEAVGGFICFGQGHVILSGCTMDETVKITGSKDAAGFVSYGSPSITISGSYCAAQITGVRNTGSFIGDCWWNSGVRHTISSSFAVGNPLDAKLGFTAINCYNTVDEIREVTGSVTKLVSADMMKGTAAKTNMPRIDWARNWTVNELGYPTVKILSVEGAVGSVWSGNVATKYAGGDGSEENPYQIATAEQLALMVTSPTENSKDKYFKLLDDIIINDISTENWQDYAMNWVLNNGTSKFSGTLDGDGHKIIGLYYNGNESIPALTSSAADATFKRLYIDGVDIKTSGYCPATFVGQGSGTIKFIECYVADNASVVSTYDSDNNRGAGGFVGYGNATISVADSAFLGTVSATGRYGAFFGNVWWNQSKLTVANSFAVGANFAGNLSCYATDSYSTVVDGNLQQGNIVPCITSAEMKGAAAKTNMPALDWGRTWKTAGEGKYPLPIFPDPNGTPGQVWTGNIAAKFVGGDGSKENPYQIATAEQLVRMTQDENSNGKYYKLICDIKLNDTSSADWKNSARNWIWNNNMFEGNFNGNGYKISGLYYSGKDSKVGLFCYAKDATIEKVVFEDVYLHSKGYAVGTIIGDANSGKVTIKECYVNNAEIISEYDDGGDRGAGGLVGYGAATLTVESSAFIGTVTAPANAGSILGNCWKKDSKGSSSHNIKDTFSTAELKFCSKQGLAYVSDFNYSAGTSKEESVTNISAEKMLGDAAKTNMPGLDWGNKWKTTGGYPVPKFADNQGSTGDLWSGLIAENYAGGTGTEEDPYLIANGEQLAKMVTDAESAGKFYKQTADIKLNDISANDWYYTARQWIWTSNIFGGTFDGDTKSITGLYYNGTKSKVGLFSYAAGATVKRVIIDNAYLYSHGFAVGSLVGAANAGTVKISECYIKENVKIESTYDASNDAGAGGLVGYGGAAVIVDGCAFLGTVKAPKFAGAMLGNCWTYSANVIKNSFATPSLKFCAKAAISADSADNYGTGTDKEYGVYLISAKDMVGENARTNMPLLNWFRSWKTTKNSYPVLNVGNSEGTPGKVWSGRIATKFAGGSGTKDDPYLISTPEQLAYLLENVLDSTGKYYKLTHDIYLNNVSDKNWESNNPRPWYWVASARKGNFNGHFNGNGHVVYGMYLNTKQETDVLYTGLFPTISDGTVIEKVGISHASITCDWSNLNYQSYAGGIAGYVFFNKSDEETDVNNIARISQCFGDSTTKITARFAGGIVCGAPRPANIDNCYFVGDVEGERIAAIIGNSWTEFAGATVTQSYGATLDEDIFCGGRAGVQNSSTSINYKNNYTNATGSVSGHAIQISVLMMRGSKAKVNMPALDFDKIWYALPNGTPVLRVFGKTDKFSNTVDPEPIKVSFVTNGGTECETVYGNPEEPLQLPTTTKTGYKFDGWYVYRELDIPFEIDYFPYFDQILYAKWSPVGIVQDFEDYPDTIYDLGVDYDYYKPGAAGYDAEFVKSGMAGIHRKGEEAKNSDFLINYEEMLTIGKEYKMTVWVNTDSDTSKAELSLVHEDYPDIYDTDSGVEKISDLSDLKQGKWQQLEYTFIARSKWIAFRTTGNTSLYFDDVMVIPTSDDIHDLNVITSQKPFNNTTNADSNAVTVAVIIGCSVVLVAAVVTGAILLIKKHKRIKK